MKLLWVLVALSALGAMAPFAIVYNDAPPSPDAHKSGSSVQSSNDSRSDGIRSFLAQSASGQKPSTLAPREEGGKNSDCGLCPNSRSEPQAGSPTGYNITDDDYYLAFGRQRSEAGPRAELGGAIEARKAIGSRGVLIITTSSSDVRLSARFLITEGTLRLSAIVAPSGVRSTVLDLAGDGLAPGLEGLASPLHAVLSDLRRWQGWMPGVLRAGDQRDGMLLLSVKDGSCAFRPQDGEQSDDVIDDGCLRWDRAGDLIAGERVQIRVKPQDAVVSGWRYRLWFEHGSVDL